MTMAAAIDRPYGGCKCVVEGEPHRRHRHHPRTRRRRGHLAQPGRRAGHFHAVSALRLSRSLAATGRRARGPRSLHRHRLRRRAPSAAAAAARAQARLRRALRQLHGRQAFDLQHGVVRPRFRRNRDAGGSRRPDRGDRAAFRGRRARAASAARLRWRDLPNPLACCRISPRPMTVRCWRWSRVARPRR